MNMTWTAAIRRHRHKVISGRDMRPFHRPMPWYARVRIANVAFDVLLVILILVGIVRSINWVLDKLVGI